MDSEILQTARLRQLQGDGGWRRRGFKPDGKKHHLPVGIISRDIQRICHRINHAYISPAGLCLQQRVVP